MPSWLQRMNPSGQYGDFNYDPSTRPRGTANLGGTSGSFLSGIGGASQSALQSNRPSQRGYLPGIGGFTQQGQPAFGLQNPLSSTPQATNPAYLTGEFNLGGETAYLASGGNIYNAQGTPYAYTQGNDIYGLPGTQYAGQNMTTYNPAGGEFAYQGQTGTYTPYNAPNNANYAGWIGGNPPIENSMAYLRGLSPSTDYGQTIWDPISQRWTQIAPTSAQGWDPNIYNQGVVTNIPGNANNAGRAQALGLTWDANRNAYVWNPTNEEMMAYGQYYGSPAGQQAIQGVLPGGVYAPGGANFAGGGTPAYNPQQGQTQGQGTQQQGAGTKVSVTLPDGTKVTGPAGSQMIQNAMNQQTTQGQGTTPAATTTTGTTTQNATSGGGLSYPMNPLADVAQQPNIVAQNALLNTMSTDPYVSGILQPYLDEAYRNIGYSGMPNSSYASAAIANAIAPTYYNNLANVQAGYAGMSSQLTDLSREYRAPFDAALTMLYNFYL